MCTCEMGRKKGATGPSLLMIFVYFLLGCNAGMNGLTGGLLGV